MEKSSVSAQQYAINIQNGTGSAKAYAQAQKANNVALQSVGTGARIASKAVKLLAGTMNTIAITAIFSLISKGISLAEKKIDDYIHRNEIAVEKAEELLDTFKSEVDTITSNQDKINGYVDEFKKLSEGVDDLGRNVSLTADEYLRYQNIVKEIVGINPSLIEGYDDENNILAKKNGLIETSIQLLKDEYSQKIKNFALPENIETAINGAVGRYNTAKDDFLDIEVPANLKYSGVKIDRNGNRETGYLNRIPQYIEDVIGVEFTGWEGGINQYILDNAEAIFDNLDKIKERAAQTKDGWEGLSDNQLIDLMDYFKELRIAYNDMNTASTSANPTLQYVAMAEDSYSELSDAQKKFVSDYINGIQITSDTTEKEKENIRKSIISLIQKLSQDDSIKQAITDIYTPPSDNETVEDYKNRIDSTLKIIREYCKENGIDIPIGIEDIQDSANTLQQSYKNTIARFTKQIDSRSAKQLRDAKNNNDSNRVAELEKKFGLSDQHILENYFKENNINTQEEIDYFNKVTENATSATEAIKLHKKALSNLAGTSADLDIFSLKDANDTLTTLGKISESIDTIQNAFSTLNSAIDEYNNSGSISIDTLQSIIALGDNWYDYLLDENGALKLDKESLQKLTASRLADMKAQIQQNMIDNVRNITDDASAKEYLASTNYQVADSIDAVTEAMVNQTLVEKQSLVQSGDLSQNNYDLIEKKLRGDIEKTNLLFNNISLDDVSLGGGSGSGSSSSKSSNTKIDFIEYRLKELEELANKVQSSIDEAVNVGDKNALLGQMQTVDNAKIDTYNKAISYYQKEASNYLEKIPAELREAAKNGAIAITELIGDNSSEIADYIQQYRDLDNSIAEATEQVSSLRQEVIKLEKEKFDNIVNAFDSIGNIISSNKSIIESQITYLETSGERIGKGYYSSLKEQSNLQLEQLYKERDVLNKQLSTAMSNGVKYGSDEWKDMYSSIQNVDQAIIDTKNDIEGYNNSLRELDWTVFDDTIQSIDTISNKLSNLLDLLKTDKVSGDFSGYSKDAITSMSLNAQKMQTANYVIEKTNKEIANLKASYNKGELSVSEYTERLENLEDTLWDNISTYNSAKEAIIEIAKARINEEVEAIEKVTEANNERISKLKEELQAEKDLQSYKRSLLEKQNDISKLQAQINARMGSTDAETIAEREKLEQELADKLKEIKEMQEDQAYDDMMDSLDKEQSAFEEAQQKKIDTLNNSLEDTETLYNNMLNVILSNTSITYNRLNELSKQYGFILEQNITSPWAKGNMSSNTFRDTVYRNLNDVSGKFTQLQTKADSISFSKLNSQLGSLNLSTLSTMVSLLSSQINVSGITTGIGNIQSAIENLSKTFETSTKKADDAINEYEKFDKAKKDKEKKDKANKSKDFWVFKTLASYKTQREASAHFGFYADAKNRNSLSIIKYGGKYVIAKWLKGFPTSGQASYQVGRLNGSGYYRRYKRGGEITENQNLDVIARSMGEDHIATIAYKEGERILTPEQNKAFLKMVDFSDLIAKSNIIKPFLPSNLSPIATPSLQIGTLLNVEGSIDKNSLPDVQKMLDKSKAEIFNEFGQMLKNKNGCRPR